MIFSEQNSESITQAYRFKSLLDIKLKRPLKTRDGEVLLNIIGFIKEIESYRKNIIELSGVRYSKTIITSWLIIPRSKQTIYRNAKDQSQIEKIVIKVPFSRIESVVEIPLPNS